MYDYKSKLVKIDEALNLIKSNDYIVTPVAPAEPREFFTNLPTIADRVKNVRISTCLNMLDYDYITNKKYKDSFIHDAWFYTPTFRAAHQNGNVSYVPNHLHLAVQGRLQNRTPNVFVAMVSMPDENGYMTMLSNAYEKQFAEHCDTIILDINPHCPRTFGDNFFHVDDVTCLIEVDYPMPQLPDIIPTEKDYKIADFIVPMIEDGSCLQLGIGGTPAAVAENLYNKKDLGIHTEMFTTAMAKLCKAGIINGSAKQVDKGLHVTTFILGTQELYDYVDNNPTVRVRTGNQTINPRIIPRNDKQISINAGLSIDLTGQVCSESMKGRHFTGTGGLADTARGAVISKGGKSFIALHSTAIVKNKSTGEKTEVSRIVPQLAMGSAVSLQRNDVQYIVTEYGIVNLQGKSLRERCESLISISHPNFREQLLKDAYNCGIIA